MKAVWSTLFAVAALILLVGGQTIATTTNPLPPTWTLNVPSAKIGWGSPILIQVIGPPGGVFRVNISAVAFSDVTPVLSFGGILTNTTGVTGAEVRNFSVPTDDFTFGGYRITLFAGVNTSNYTPVGSFAFHIVDPLNDTAIQDAIAFLQYNYTIQHRIQLGLGVQQETLEGQLDAIYLTAFAETIFFVFALILTRTSAGEREWSLRFKRAIATMFYGSWFREFAEWTAAPFRPAPLPIPGKYYRARCCRLGRIIDRTKPEIEAHLREVHHVQYPRLHANYYINASTARYIQRRLGTDAPPRTRDEASRQELKKLHLDFRNLDSMKGAP